MTEKQRREQPPAYQTQTTSSMEKKNTVIPSHSVLLSPASVTHDPSWKDVTWIILEISNSESCALSEKGALITCCPSPSHWTGECSFVLQPQGACAPATSHSSPTMHHRAYLLHIILQALGHLTRSQYSELALRVRPHSQTFTIVYCYIWPYFVVGCDLIISYCA